MPSGLGRMFWGRRDEAVVRYECGVWMKAAD